MVTPTQERQKLNNANLTFYYKDISVQMVNSNNIVGVF